MRTWQSSPEEAAHKISLWIQAPGQDGHWKGNRSGWAPYFAPFAIAWTSEADSIFVGQFKAKRVQDLLTPKLYQGGEPPARPAFPAFNLARRALAVRFVNVKEKGDTGLLEPDIDVGNDADFFSKVTVGDTSFLERVIQNNKNFDNPWFVIEFVDSALASKDVRIDVFDEDGAVAGDDDHCDIHPTTGRQHIALAARIADGHLSGDATGLHDTPASALTFSGQKPDKDRAVVTFFVRSSVIGP